MIPPLKPTTTKQLNAKWEACRNDADRWRFVIHHARRISMALDNDKTCVSWTGRTWYAFDGYIGWDSCAVALGKAIGLKSCELV